MENWETAVFVHRNHQNFPEDQKIRRDQKGIRRGVYMKIKMIIDLKLVVFFFFWEIIRSVEPFPVPQLTVQSELQNSGHLSVNFWKFQFCDYKRRYQHKRTRDPFEKLDALLKAIVLNTKHIWVLMEVLSTFFHVQTRVGISVLSKQEIGNSKEKPKDTDIKRH